MSQRTILERLETIGTTKGELRVQKEMLDELLGADKLLQDQVMEANKLIDQAKNRRKELLATAEAVAILNQMKEIKTELKELGWALTNDLLEYYADERTLTIEDQDGDKREIAFNGKVRN